LIRLRGKIACGRRFRLLCHFGTWSLRTLFGSWRRFCGGRGLRRGIEEIEVMQIPHRLQRSQGRRRHPGLAEVQIRELRERRQLRKTGSCDRSSLKMKSPQMREPAQRIE